MPPQDTYGLVPKPKAKAGGVPKPAAVPFGPQPQPIGFAPGGGAAARQAFPTQTLGPVVPNSIPNPPVGPAASPAVPLAYPRPVPLPKPAAAPPLSGALKVGRGVSPRVAQLAAPAATPWNAATQSFQGSARPSPTVWNAATQRMQSNPVSPTPAPAPTANSGRGWSGAGMRNRSPKVVALPVPAPANTPSLTAALAGGPGPATAAPTAPAPGLSAALAGGPGPVRAASGGGPGPMRAAPVAAATPAAAAPAAPASLAGRVAGKARGLVGRVGGKLGPALGPMAAQMAIAAASPNPDEGFMHLGGGGSFRDGARRLTQSLGHAIAGSPQPGDVTRGEFDDALLHHTWAGDVATGLNRMGQTVHDGIFHPVESAKRFGRGLSVLGDKWFGDGPPEAVRDEGETPMGMTRKAMDGMNADQLNARYASMGIGGKNPEPPQTPFAAATAPAIASTAPPQSYRTRESYPPPWEGGPASVSQGPHGWEPTDPSVERMQDAMTRANDLGDYHTTASLAQALASYRGATASQDAAMLGAQASWLGAQADMEKVRNPLAGYMSPVGLQLLDAQAGGAGNVIGTAQAHGLGLGPHGEISPQGLPSYAALRHPEFAGVIGNKDASADDILDVYHQSRSQLSPRDPRLAELDDFASQYVRSRLSRADMEAAIRAGWSPFGRGADQASRNRQGLMHLRQLPQLGVR